MQRNKALDISKGIGIFLVVLGHVISSNALIGGININNLIYVFHMPFFFFVSGISTYYETKKDLGFKKYLSKKIRSIMIPYFIFSIISFLYWLLLESRFREISDGISSMDIFINIFTMKIDSSLLVPNIVLWFLPCLFISLTIFYFIRKINNRIIRICLTSFLFVIGYFLSIYKIILPFSIETCLISIFFIDIGFELSPFINSINTRTKKICLFLIFTILYLLAFIFNGDVSMLGHEYCNPILFVIGVIGGMGLVYLISSVIDNHNRIGSKGLSYLGMNSIIIMLIHEPIKRAVIFVISKITNVAELIIRSNLLYSIICSIIIIALMIPIIYVINNFFPILIGKSKKNKIAKLEKQFTK